MIIYPISTASTSHFTNLLPFNIPTEFKYAKIDAIHLENSYNTISEPPENLPHFILLVDPNQFSPGVNFTKNYPFAKVLHLKPRKKIPGRMYLFEPVSFHQIFITIKDGQYKDLGEILPLINFILKKCGIDQNIKITLNEVTEKCEMKVRNLEACYISKLFLMTLGFTPPQSSII